MAFFFVLCKMVSMKTPAFSFYKVTKEHQSTIIEWLHKDHVSLYFYGEGLANTLKNLDLYVNGKNHNGDYTFEYFIGAIDKRPMAFLMTSLVAGPLDQEDPYDKYYVEGKKTITLDLLIGDEAFLGKGLSAPLIHAFLKDQMSDADFVLIDPEESNERAIHVYEKAGFKKQETFIPSYCKKPHIMMRLET